MNGQLYPVVLYYDITVRAIANDGYVQLVNNLNGFVVHNTGNTICVVNDDPLQPGESKSVGGHWGAIYAGRLFMRFVLPGIPPPVPNNLCFVTQLFWVSAPGGTIATNLNPILGL